MKASGKTASLTVRPEPVFSLANVDLGDSWIGVLGAWQPHPAQPSARVAFGPSGASSKLPTWRAAYPRDRRQITTAVAAAEAELAATRRALDLAQQRLNRVAQIEQTTPRRMPIVSFGQPRTETTLPQPEQDLREQLGRLRSATAPLSFGPGNDGDLNCESIWQAAHDTLQRLQAAFGQAALVETQIGGTLIGRTRVSWVGDTETAFASQATSEAIALHGRTVALALQSRENLLCTLRLVIQGATTLGLVIATPGGAFLALPAVYRFVTQILGQFNQSNPA